MANIKGTPGGLIHVRDQMYRDEGDGTHAEDRSALLRGWDEDSSLAWVRVPVTSAGRLKVEASAPSGEGKTLAFANIDTASSGDNTIVAADATRKIKVVSYVLVSAGTVNVRWKSGAGTNKSGAMPLIANTGVGVAGAPSAHLLETAANAALVLNLSGAIQVSGHISYFLEA